MTEETTGQGPSDTDTATTATTDAPSAIGTTLQNSWVAFQTAGESSPAPEHTPTREEAREMFKANPGLWSVLTDEGNMTRDQA